MPNFPTEFSELAQLIGISSDELRYFSYKIERHTRHRVRSKPNGELRQITAPSKALKPLLRRLDKVVLRQIPLHRLFFLRPSSSYVEMVKEHCGRSCLLTADIDDFYPTVTPTKVQTRLLAEGLNKTIARVITRLTTVSFSLPQGFPTSSTIAGIILNPVLVRLEGLETSANLKVGLYADNLAISADYHVGKFESLVTKIFRQNGFSLDKFAIMSQQDTQEIMNIVVNNGMSVKSNYRRQIRMQIFLLHKMQRDGAAADLSELREKVRGMLQYVRQINIGQADQLKQYAERLNMTM